MGHFNNQAQLAEEHFNQLFHQYKDRVSGFVQLMVKDAHAAEEITQEIFIKIWVCRDLLEHVDNFEGYLFTIARNKTLNHLRKAAYDMRLMKELMGYMREAHNDVEESIQLRDYNKILNEGIARLPPQRRLVYELSRTQGLNHDEIASQLNISKNTVKNHLVTTLTFLRQHLVKNAPHSAALLIFFLKA
jgi:RNA polymerase sigma-70 factor (ECF subfamily)